MAAIDGVYGARPDTRGFLSQQRRAPMADGKIQGEGDYVSGRKYQDMQHEFAKNGPVEEKAREAEEALDGPEAAELEEARKSTGKGETH
jgi:hypothetical protein